MTGCVDFRVTSIRKLDQNHSIFAGVELSQDNRIKSGKEIVVVSASSDILPMLPARGQHWRVTGQMTKCAHEHNGFYVTELCFDGPDKCEITLPNTGEQFIQFIAKEPDFRGIGEVKAREIWQAFGPDIYRVLGNRDEQALRSLLTENSAQVLIEGYEKYENLKLANWFAEHKIPASVTQRLFKYHKNSSADAIAENPYRLTSFGVAFDKVDALAKESFNISGDDQRRLVAAIECALQIHVSKGHTVATDRDLFPTLSRLLHSEELANDAIRSGFEQAVFVLNKETSEYHPTAMYVMEQVVAKRFNWLAQQSRWKDEYEDVFDDALDGLYHVLTPQQATAVIMALKNSISCITGGAGTGKTTALRTIMRAYHLLDFNIHAVALSGRAAKRLHESTGFETSTIAKFLRQEPVEKNDNILVIDEASMLDLATVYRLVTHVNPNTRFLLVGDPNQLPPIGAGLVLGDVVKARSITTTELDIVKRQKGSTGIPEYSLRIQRGEMPEHLSINNIHFHEVTGDDIALKCVELYANAPADSQIIGATYKALHGGIDRINDQCQTILNPASQRLEFEQYGQRHYLDLRQNDPVIFTQNNYDAGVQNGTLGILESVGQTEKHYGKVILDTGKEIELTASLLDSIKLGYAISLHKAQGSQFKRVIVALNNSKLIDRAWLYTAITRSEVELHIVGSRRVFEEAIVRESAIRLRRTGLHALLKGIT